MKKIPVLVLAFNRADHVAKAMASIREYRPERLYLECDGPRVHKQGEAKAVEETRKTMLEAVDWPCEIKTLFREENLGCANAVNDAITWFFKHEEYGVICEDDIVFSLDFFKFCEELLPRYIKEDRIMCINSQNPSKRTDIPNSYVYGYRSSCWGWATWRRAWAKMDMSMSAVPNLKYGFLFKRLGVFEGLITMKYFKTGYKRLPYYNSWANRWYLSILANNGLTITPGVNLSKNIGIDGGAHFETGDVDPYADLLIGNIQWPLIYNDSFVIDSQQSRYDEMDFFRWRMIGLKKRIKRLFA